MCFMYDMLWFKVRALMPLASPITYGILLLRKTSQRESIPKRTVSENLIIICFLHCSMCVPSWVWLFMTPWTIACQAPLSMEFFRQEYYSGLLFPPLGDLPNPGIELASFASPVFPALAGRFFTTSERINS